MPLNHNGDYDVADQPVAPIVADQPVPPIVADQPVAHVVAGQPPPAHVPVTRDVALKPPHELAGLQKHSLGGRTFNCAACNARLWRHEVKTHGMGGVLCCNRGKSCTLQNLFPQRFPEPLDSFLVSFWCHFGVILVSFWCHQLQITNSKSPTPNPRVQAFRKNIRAYGSALQMASSRLHLPQVQGISMIVIRGAVHHLLGPLQPGPGQAPKFAQLYIIDDPEQQVQARVDALGGGQGPDGGFDRDLLRELQQMLQQHNVYVHEFKNFMNDIPAMPEFELFIRADGSVDRRRYNAPTANEVAGFMPGKCFGMMRHTVYIIHHTFIANYAIICDLLIIIGLVEKCCHVSLCPSHMPILQVLVMKPPPLAAFVFRGKMEGCSTLMIAMQHATHYILFFFIPGVSLAGTKGLNTGRSIMGTKNGVERRVERMEETR